MTAINEDFPNHPPSPKKRIKTVGVIGANASILAAMIAAVELKTGEKVVAVSGHGLQSLMPTPVLAESEVIADAFQITPCEKENRRMRRARERKTKKFHEKK